MALRWWWRCGASSRRAPPLGFLPRLSPPGPGSRAPPPPAPSAAVSEMCHFTQRRLTLSFPKICNVFWRFHRTSTSHLCSCSKTVSDEKYQDPFQLGRKDLKNLYEDIKKELLVSTAELKEMCDYYFDGKGKAFRPMIVVLMARACNIHHNNSREVQASQRSVAIIAEMIHTASLVHDDVIDDANSRRGKMTVNQIWGERKAVLAGDFILSAASVALARIGNTTIISVLTQVIEDLVRGEFLQLGSKENENERFAHYLEKTFKKTASLIANSCKAVFFLKEPSQIEEEIAFPLGGFCLQKCCFESFHNLQELRIEVLPSDCGCDAGEGGVQLLFL
ncbi:all trans-polyprenyl-diphosphate synthase PDSS1 isoform X3 [Phalacrocorax carbo]|uniref:all trans-polyprenyl-diphosphate synthase PDSS1 isoform X3 n=1 Tax=Phalacrocorax carbo TaxID=9209 RepID=UPI00311A8DB3